MRPFSNEHTYRYNWGNVVLAFWRKYPNKFSEHVKEVDTFSRKFDPVSGDLTTYRMISCESSLPGWMASLGISSHAYALEETVVNAKNKTMVVRSRNLTGASMMVVEEKCSYVEDPVNKSFTKYTQEANIKAFLPLLHWKLENYTLSSMASKSKQGLTVMEELCHTLATKGLHALNFSPVVTASAVASTSAASK